MAATTSPYPSVAPADSNDSPLWRFNGTVKAVLLDRPDCSDDCAFYNPKSNCFAVVGKNPKGYLKAEIVGGPDCGTGILIGPEWLSREGWAQICDPA